MRPTSQTFSRCRVFHAFSLGDAAQELEGTLMRRDPVGQRLAPGGLGVGVAGSAQHGNEHLGPSLLAGGLVDDWHGRAAIVDEQLLAGAVDLAHAAPLTVPPGAVMVAEPTGAVGLVAVDLDVLRPEQLQGDALALERLVDLEVV